ncbi:MAG: hypothetical protein OEW08_14955, partial [Gammaproteobacteria bacterium]|nr:hypothetical protein [Gammaproteobacteria bacterium]
MTTARTRIIRTEQDRHAVANELQHLPLNKPWRVVVDFYVPKRSLAQNRLYWLWMTHLGGYLGYSREEMHEELALMFLEPITYTGL